MIGRQCMATNTMVWFYKTWIGNSPTIKMYPIISEACVCACIIYAFIHWRVYHNCVWHIIGVCVRVKRSNKSWSFSSIIRRNNQKATQEMKESQSVTSRITQFSCNPLKKAWGVNKDCLWCLKNVFPCLRLVTFKVLQISCATKKYLVWESIWSMDLSFVTHTHTHATIIIPVSDVSLSWSSASMTRENDF